MLTPELKREADEILRELLRRIHSGELSLEDEDSCRAQFDYLYTMLTQAITRPRLKRHYERQAAKARQAGKTERD